MVVINKPIEFTDTSSDRIYVSWDFGDGTSLGGSPVSHTYTTAGTYRVTDTITALSGAKKTCFQDIVVSTPPSNNAGIIGLAAVGITIAVAAYLLTKKETSYEIGVKGERKIPRPFSKSVQV